MTDLTILLEDNHCLALAKPPGIPTQAPPDFPSLESLAKAYLKEKYHKPGNVYLGVPHRLDRPASGVVLFARNSKAASRLAIQFQKRQVSKTYWAIVEGLVTPPEGTWEDWLGKVPDEARAEVTTADAQGAKQASLSYRVLRSTDDLTLLEIALHTGRMHQIRVQAATRGWPILGDKFYGAQRDFGDVAGERERAIALHARSLTFLHPLSYEPVTLTADVPNTWDGFLTTIDRQAVGLEGEANRMEE